MPHRHMQFDNSLKIIGWGWRQYIWRDVASIKIYDVWICYWSGTNNEAPKSGEIHFEVCLTASVTLDATDNTNINIISLAKINHHVLIWKNYWRFGSSKFVIQSWAGLSSHKSSHRWRWEELFSQSVHKILPQILPHMKMGGIVLPISPSRWPAWHWV